MWATPVPVVPDLAALNDHLRRCCVTARERTSGSNTETVAVRFDRDRAAALSLPTRPFDACVIDGGTADEYQTVAFDDNRYSVPRRCAFRPVTVKGFIDRVDPVADGRVVATHSRCYARHERVLDPSHFLAILAEKPATLDHAPVYRDWALPPAFARLRTRLEADQGTRAGVRQHIRVPRLLARFPLAVVEAAVAAALARGRPTAATITAAAERLARTDTALTLTDIVVSPIPVPPPDLSRFDRLPSRSPDEGEADARPDHDAVGRQPEDATAADDVGRARKVGA